MDKVAEFEKLLKTVLSQHDEQEQQIKSLTDALDAVNKRLVLGMARDMGSNDSRFHPEDRHRHMAFTEEEQARSFLQICNKVLAGDVATLKTLQVGSDPDGGYTVPEDFRAQLIRLVEVFGLARQRCLVLPQGSHEMVWPKLSSGVTVYWIDEGQPITESTPQFGELRMVAKKLAALVPATTEIMEDSAIAMANLVATLFAEAIAQEEDRVAFAGDVVGASDPFNGVLYDPGVTTTVMDTGETAFSDMTADHLADMLASLTNAQAAGARWLMHRTIFNIMRKLKDSTGDYIYQMPAEGQPGTIWGYPYDLSDVMPAITDSAADAPFVSLGQLRHYYIGDRRSMSVASSSHVGFTSDKIYLRVTERVSMAAAIPEAFAVLKTSAT